jgi:hypothetical protein
MFTIVRPREGSPLLAVSEATVPKVTVVLRKAYGAGDFVMNRTVYDPCIAAGHAQIDDVIAIRPSPGWPSSGGSRLAGSRRSSGGGASTACCLFELGCLILPAFPTRPALRLVLPVVRS